MKITAETSDGNLLTLTCTCGRTKKHARPSPCSEIDIAHRETAFKEHKCRKPKKVKA